MPTHPSSPFSHAHTRTHHQPDSSPPGLAQWACYKGLSIWVQSRLDPCPKDTYIHRVNLNLCHCSIREVPEEAKSCWQHWKHCSYWTDCDPEAFVAVYSIQLDVCPS